MAKITLGRYASTYVPCSRDHERDLRCASYVLGSAGTGKSTLLANLAEQFAAAGEGVLLVDTKGELAQDLASRTTHPRLVYVSPGETVFPSGKRFWALNPFEFDRAQPHLEDIAVANLLSLFERMGLARMDTMVQVRQLLQMSARLSLTLPQPTLVDLLRILYEPSFRAQLLRADGLSSAVRRFWDGFGALTPHQQRDKANSTIPRLNELLSSEVIDRLVSVPRSTVRLAEWLDAGCLVVCNLGTQTAPENSRLLGNLVVAHLVNAAFARTPGQGRVWRVIVDEFHELAGAQFAELITQARKYRVFPVMAHQNLAQLGEELTNAVTACPLRFFLATSAEDRLAVRRLFGEETATGLSELPRFMARVHLRDGAEGRFRQETLRLNDWWAEADQDQLRRAVAHAEDDRYTVAAAPAPMTTARDAAEADDPPPHAQEKESTDAPAAAANRRRALDVFSEDSATGTDQTRSEPGASLPALPHPARDRGAGRARPARAVDYFPDR